MRLIYIKHQQILDHIDDYKTAIIIQCATQSVALFQVLMLKLVIILNCLDNYDIAYIFADIFVVYISSAKQHSGELLHGQSGWATAHVI